MADSPRRLNPVDLALGLILLALLSALLVQVFVPNPLRQSVLDEAERPYVEIVTESEAVFLDMTAGDRQLGERGIVEAELLEVTRSGDRLRAVWKVRAREWRGWTQFGSFVLKPGERVEIYTDNYKFIGWILEVRP